MRGNIGSVRAGLWQRYGRLLAVLLHDADSVTAWCWQCYGRCYMYYCYNYLFFIYFGSLLEANVNFRMHYMLRVYDLICDL